MNPKTLIVLYEPEQIDAALAYIATLTEPYGIVASDLEVEYMLEERGVAFISGKEYRSDLAGERLLVAEQWVERMVSGGGWNFFTYRGVPLAGPLFYSVQMYLQYVLYYLDIMAGLLRVHPQLKKLIIFPSAMQVFQTSGFLAGREIAAPVACARLVAEQHGIEVIVPPLPKTESVKPVLSAAVFDLKRRAFSFVLFFINAGVALLRRPQPVRLLISDYWRNVSPFMEKMRGTELIFLDRAEALHAGWRNIWNFRMRFLHLEPFASAQKTARARTLESFLSQWWRLRADDRYWSHCTFRGYPVGDILKDALDDVVRDGAREALTAVDGAYGIVQKVKPHAVLLRVSISRQIHFAVLAAVAKILGVPSLELQHGLEYLGPGSPGKRHGAEFIGTYGKFVNEEFKKMGYAPERLVSIGSPRFDRYTHTAAHAGAANTFLCIAPMFSVEDSFDSYSLENYFSQLAGALKAVPESSAIIKLRSTAYRSKLYHGIIARVCAGMPYEIVGGGSLQNLFYKTSVVVSPSSTVVLESLQCGMPTVVMAINKIEAPVVQRNFSAAVTAGALCIAHTQEELQKALYEFAGSSAARANLKTGAKKYLDDWYSFDGKASERIVGLIAKLSKSARL